MPRPKKSFSPEFKDEAVKMVIETSRPITRVAKELGINEGTLGNWVNAYRREHAGEEPPLTVSERARLRELEPVTINRDKTGDRCQVSWQRWADIGDDAQVEKTAQMIAAISATCAATF